MPVNEVLCGAPVLDRRVGCHHLPGHLVLCLRALQPPQGRGSSSVGTDRLPGARQGGRDPLERQLPPSGPLSVSFPLVRKRSPYFEPSASTSTRAMAGKPLAQAKRDADL